MTVAEPLQAQRTTGFKPTRRRLPNHPILLGVSAATAVANAPVAHAYLVERRRLAIQASK